MGIGYIFVDTVYPLVLLIASVTRPSLLSFIYLVGFVIASIWSPHPLLPIRNLFAYLQVFIISLVSLASILGQIAFNAKYESFVHYPVLPTLPPTSPPNNETDFTTFYTVMDSNATANGTLPDVFVLLGFHKITDAVIGIQQIVPDLVVLVAAIFSMVLLFEFKVLHEPIEHHQYRPPTYSKVITTISFLLTFVCAVCFSSLMTAVFLALYLLMMLMISFGKKIHTLELMLYPLTLLITTSCVILFNVFQVPIIYESMADDVGHWLGVFHYTRFTRSTWPVLTGYASMVLLFLLTTSIHKIRAVRKAYYGSDRLSPRQKEMDEPFLTGYRNHPEYNVPDGSHIASLFNTYGWVLCVTETVALCYFIEPSVLSTILLAFALLGTLIPLSWFANGVRVVTVYFIGFFYAQFIYSALDLHSTSSQQEKYDNIGLKNRRFDQEWLYWGAQAVVLFSYAMYSYSAYLQKTKRRSDGDLIDDGKGKRKATSTKTTPEPDTVEVREDQEESAPVEPPPPAPPVDPAAERALHRLDKRGYTSLSVMSNLGSYLKDSQRVKLEKYINDWKSFVAACKDIAKLIMTTLLYNSYIASLIGLYVCGLTHVNLLNAGYLLFFIFFIISPVVAKKLWFTLVLYAQAVLLMLFVWQLSWTEPAEKKHSILREIVGLQHFDNLWVDTIWNLIIVAFSVIQWNVNLVLKEKMRKKNEILSRSPSVEKYPSWITVITTAIHTGYRNFGLLLCYVALALVAVLSDLSVVSMLYMTIVLLCWLVHYLSANPHAHLRRIWLPVVIYNGVVLVAKYMYQFDPVHDYIQENYMDGRTNSTNYLPLNQIGLVHYVHVTDLFKELAGNVVVLVLCVFQSYVFFHKAGKASFTQEMKNHPRLIRVLGVAKALVYLHGGKVVSWLVFGIAISSYSMIHLIYILLILLASTLRSGRRGMHPAIGFILLIFAELVVLAQMAFGFAPVQRRVASHSVSQIYADWIGLDYGKPSHTLGSHLAIVTLITLHRMSYWWIHDHPQESAKPLPQSMQDVEGKKDDSEAKVTQLRSVPAEDIATGAYSTNHVGKPHLERAPTEVAGRITAYLANFYSIYGYEILFLVLSLGVTLRANLMGIIYLIVIIIGLVTPYKKAVKGLSFFVGIMGVLIVAQYFFGVGIPKAGDAGFPWALSTDNYRVSVFFLLSPPDGNKRVLLVDFAVFYFACLVVRAERLTIKLPQNFFNFTGPDNFHHPRLWHVAGRYFIAKYSAYVVLVGVFVCGLGEADIISFGYLGFSLMVLFMGNRFTQGWNRLWEIGRAYAITSLCVYILYQMLAYGLAKAGVDVRGFVHTNVFGLYDLYEDPIDRHTIKHAFNATINDALVVLMLSYQKRIFLSRDFRAMNAYVRAKRMLMLETAQEFFSQKREKELRERIEADRQQQLRWERLQLVKMQRAQGILSRSTSAAATPMVPTPIASPNVSSAGVLPPSSSQALAKSGTLQLSASGSPANSSHKKSEGEIKKQEEGVDSEGVTAEVESADSKLSMSAKIGVALRKVGAVVSKYARKGMKKFINWLDEDGAQKEKDKENEDLLIVMDGGNEVARPSEDEKKKHKTKFSEEKKKKYRSVSHLKPPTSNWHWFKRVLRGIEAKITTESKAVSLSIRVVLLLLISQICFFAFMLNGVVYANVLSLPYPVAVFAFGRLQDDPRPSKGFWRVMLGYSTFVILIKYLFQLISCFGPYCSDDGIGSETTNAQREIPTTQYTIGILHDPKHFVQLACLDALAFLLILWHRHVMRTRGIWDYTEREVTQADEDTPTMPLVSTEELHKLSEESAVTSIHESGAASTASSPPNSPRGTYVPPIVPKVDPTQPPIAPDSTSRTSSRPPSMHLPNPNAATTKAAYRKSTAFDAGTGMGLTMGLGLGGLGLGVVPAGSEGTKTVNEKARKHIVAIPIPKLFRRKKKKKPVEHQDVPAGRATVSNRNSVAYPPPPPPSNNRHSVALTTYPPSGSQTYSGGSGSNNNNNNNATTTAANTIHNAIVGSDTSARRTEPEQTVTPSLPTSPTPAPEANSGLSANAQAITSILGGPPSDSNSNKPTSKQDHEPAAIVSIHPTHEYHTYDVHDEEIPDENEPSHYQHTSDSDDDDSDFEDEGYTVLFLELLKLIWDHFKATLYHIIYRERTGRDYYTPIFLIDFTCFIILIVFQQWFTGNTGNSVADFLEQSVIPRNYVGLLLAQFGLIVLDRAIYLYRSVRAKLILQVILTVLYHALLFFYLPDLNKKLFAHAAILVIFYLLKCAYLYISALQICYGYPFFVSKSAFMEGYGDFNSAVFSAYRAIPFVFEISTLLEWIVTDTTLLFYDWIKCEDIFAQLYQVKCRNEWIKRQGRQKGTKQPKLEKCSTGVLLFIVLVFVIWFPLIILSSGLPGSSANPVNNIAFSVGVQGWDPLYQINQDFNGKLVSGSEFKTLRQNFFFSSDDSSNTQILVFPNSSESIWTITPPSRQALIASLNPATPARLLVQYTLTRNQTLNSVISGSNTVNLDFNSTLQLINVLNGTSTDPITIPNLYPRYIRLPGVSGAARYQGASATGLLSLQSGSYTIDNITVAYYWWALNQMNQTLANNLRYSNDPAHSLFEGPSPQMVSISVTMPSALASTLVSAGVIGLWRFLRLYVTGITLRIWIENLPYCDDLIRMCHDIFIARQYHDLMLEEELYQELIQIFRSPETLIEKTKLKQE